MLIEFRAENHRSLRDEQALTMEASGSDANDLRPRTAKGHSKKLLPLIALYGANASGKSNILEAFSFMKMAVLASYRLWEPNEGILRTPFAWGEKREEPSLFEATFLVDKVKYLYGFEVTDNFVKEEWLYTWPNGRKTKLFERYEQNFTFGATLKGPNEITEEITRENALFLSVAVQNNHEQLRPLLKWFQQIKTFQSHASSRFYRSMGLLPHSDDAWNWTKNFIKSADTGISNIKVKKKEIERADNRPLFFENVLFQHSASDENSWLDFQEESKGTQTLFQMAAPIYNALTLGSLLLIDELDSSLHVSIGNTIIQLFNHPKTNPNNAQLIFTTHDTNLLGTIPDEPALRRDQIWFTEKDKEGGTNLYPLTNYKPRKSENLERGYLQGRYGAIPFLGDFNQLTEDIHGET